MLDHAKLKGHKACVIWLTGISGAGKSTIAGKLEQLLHEAAVHSYLLDGDDVRKGLCADLGFAQADRSKNVRRVAEVAKLFYKAGLVVVVTLISPFKEDRAFARSLFPEGAFLEVYVNTPLSVAESRDVKGLYQKARRGEIAHFTGIDSRYELPSSPEVEIDTMAMTAEEAAAYLLSATLAVIRI